MQEIILFILTFIFVFIIYELFIIRKAKRKNSKKKPIEVIFLTSKYKLDLNKIEYRKLLRIISIVSSLDISILVTIVILFDNTIVQILVAFIAIMPIVFISYGLIGKYYKKRGMIKDE